MPVKNDMPPILPMEPPGVSNLAVCRYSFEGELNNLRVFLENKGKEGQEMSSLVNAVDSSGRTALHWACSNKQTAIINFLLEQCKVDATILDESQWSALMIASSVGSGEIVDVLLDYLGPSKVAALVNEKNQSGQTALHYAASKNHMEVAKSLLESGKADVNVQDKYGNTPLHRAAGKGHLGMVRLLLSTGKVNESLCDATGNTALHFACEEDHKDIANLLVEHGFNVDRKNAVCFLFSFFSCG